MARPAAQPRPVGPGLPPVCGAHARVLILGSFPSPKSRAQGFYYGHPQNRFWPLVAALFGQPAPAWQDLDAKKQLILRHDLALWDVVCRCTIAGASDASIRDVVPNAVPELAQHLGVQAVFCNGATAAKLYRRYLEGPMGRPAVTLPSTSPANAVWTLPRLRQAWGEALAPWLPELVRSFKTLD